MGVDNRNPAFERKEQHHQHEEQKTKEIKSVSASSGDRGKSRPINHERRKKSTRYDLPNHANEIHLNGEDAQRQSCVSEEIESKTQHSFEDFREDERSVELLPDTKELVKEEAPSPKRRSPENLQSTASSSLLDFKPGQKEDAKRQEGLRFALQDKFGVSIFVNDVSRWITQ